MVIKAVSVIIVKTQHIPKMSNEMIHNIATYHYEDEMSNLMEMVGLTYKKLNDKIDNLDHMLYNNANKTSTFESIRRNDIRDFAATRAEVLQYIHLMPGSLNIQDNKEEIENYFKTYLTDVSFQQFKKKFIEKDDLENMQSAFTTWCETLKMTNLKPFKFRWENWKQSFPGKTDD